MAPSLVRAPSAGIEPAEPPGVTRRSATLRLGYRTVARSTFVPRLTATKGAYRVSVQRMGWSISPSMRWGKPLVS